MMVGSRRARVYYFRKGEKPLATQIQATPVVTGRYAKEILEELETKQTAEDKKFIQDTEEFFRQIPKRGD